MTRPVWPGQPGAGCRHRPGQLGAGCRRFGSACDGGPRRSGWSRATSATERRRSVVGRRSTHGSAAARARDLQRPSYYGLQRALAAVRGHGTGVRAERACFGRRFGVRASRPPETFAGSAGRQAHAAGLAFLVRCGRVLSCRARFRHRLFGTATGRPGVQLRGAQRAVRAHSGMSAQLRLRRRQPRSFRNACCP